MRKIVILVLFSAVLITACGGPAEQINEEVVAPQQTLEETPADTRAQEPTSTPLPDELVNQIEQSYMALALVQATGELLNETAMRIQEGELEGFEAFGYLMGVAAMAIGVLQSSMTPFLANGLEARFL